MEKLAHEHLVNDSHPLRIRTVRFGEGPPRQDWNLQCSEIVGGGVYLIRHNLLPGFFAVVDGYASRNQRSLIRQAHVNSGLLHSGDLPHGRGTSLSNFRKAAAS